MNFLLTILDHSGEEATVSKLGKTKGCKDQTWNFIIDTGIWDVCRAKTHLCHQNQESLVSAPGGASWSCWSHRSDLQLLVRSVGSHSLCKHQDKLVELIQYSKSVIQWSDYLRKKNSSKKWIFRLFTVICLRLRLWCITISPDPGSDEILTLTSEPCLSLHSAKQKQTNFISGCHRLQGRNSFFKTNSYRKAKNSWILMLSFSHVVDGTLTETLMWPASSQSPCQHNLGCCCW